MLPSVTQAVLTGRRLWTPANLSVIPRVMIDCRDAVWSGSNLSTINCTGVDAGAMTVNGPPTKGTASNGITPILTDAVGEYLSRAITTWGTSKALCLFWLGKVATTGAVQGAANFRWNSGDEAACVFYVNVASAGAIMLGRKTGGEPMWRADVDFAVDTTGYHSAYWQGSSTVNYAYRDGEERPRTGAGIPDTLAAAQNYPNTQAWQFGRGDSTGAEGLQGETFVWALFDASVPFSDLQKLEGYWRWQINQLSELPFSHPYKHRPPTV